jgi:hypothetical protein
MQRKLFSRALGLSSCALLLFGGAVWAQQLAQRPQKAAPRGLVYDAAREVVLEGTVINYTANSQTAPLGARVVLQTASGPVDVHLGSASLLQASNFSLASGDVVRVLGANASGRGADIFLARMIQKGAQAVALRTPAGAPLSIAGGRALGGQKAQQHGGAR